MIKAFLVYEIESSNFLENAGNFFLSPVRYFGDGRTYSIINNTLRPFPSYEDTHPLFSLVMIAGLITVVAGLILKGLAWLSTEVRERHALALIEDIAPVPVAAAPPQPKPDTFIWQNKYLVTSPNLNGEKIFDRIYKDEDPENSHEKIKNTLGLTSKTVTKQQIAEYLAQQNIFKERTVTTAYNSETLSLDPITEIASDCILLSDGFAFDLRENTTDRDWIVNHKLNPHTKLLLTDADNLAVKNKILQMRTVPKSPPQSNSSKKMNNFVHDLSHLAQTLCSNDEFEKNVEPLCVFCDKYLIEFGYLKISNQPSLKDYVLQMQDGSLECQKAGVLLFKLADMFNEGCALNVPECVAKAARYYKIALI